jgi:DNA-binding NtrC family response regulator
MSPSVLIVEPYADLRSAIESALTRGEYDCVCARDEEDAIRRLQSESFSAILLAPTLPITEDAVMHFLHEHQPSEMRKVILMTDDEAGSQPQETECRVLLKPFDGNELFRQVSRRKFAGSGKVMRARDDSGMKPG